MDFETIGYIIIGIFLVSWIGSTLFYKLKNYDNIEATAEPVPVSMNRTSERGGSGSGAQPPAKR